MQIKKKKSGGALEFKVGAQEKLVAYKLLHIIFIPVQLDIAVCTT